MRKLINGLIVFSFLSFAVSVTQADENWKIGALLCLSGDCAADGDSALKGAQIAIEEINSAGGVLGKRISLVVQDTNEAVSGAKTVSAYRQIRLDKDIHFLIGPTWTPGGLSLIPILKTESDVIITSPSLGVADFNEAADNIFNSRGTDEIPSRHTARYAFEKGFKKMAIFSSQQPWESLQAKYFQDEFEKLGGTIVVKVEPLPTITTLSSEALKIVSAKPEAVFFSSLIQQALAAKELKKLNFNKQKFAAIVDDTRINEANGALEGTIFFTYQKPDNVFKKKFVEKYNKIPEIPAATGYDTVYAYAKAVEQAKSFETAIVKKEIVAVNFVGASGRIQFDDKGCVVKDVSGWGVKGQTLEAVH